MMVWNIKLSNALLNSSTSEKKRLQSITTVTFTRLLYMSMVANSFSGFSNSEMIVRSRGASLSSCWSSSPDREKNPISEAETNPDKRRQRPAKTKAMIAPTDGGAISIAEDNSDK